MDTWHAQAGPKATQYGNDIAYDVARCSGERRWALGCHPVRPGRILMPKGITLEITLERPRRSAGSLKAVEGV